MMLGLLVVGSMQGCAVPDASPTQDVRGLANSFGIEGFERTGVYEWDGPGARVVLNFKPTDPARRAESCTRLRDALVALEGFVLVPNQGVVAGGACAFNGRVGKHPVTSGSSTAEPGNVYVAFWNSRAP